MTNAFVHVVAVLASVVVAAFIAVALFLALCAIAACVRSSQITRAEEQQPAQPRARNTGAISDEADPIESYPVALPVASSATPLAPVLLGVAPFTIGSPLTNRVIGPETRQ